jgi:hypothetical protein
MAGAVTTTFVGYRVAFRGPTPLLSPQFVLPSREPIDGRLLLGAVLFGIGWGITGFCPGPGLVSIPLLATGTMVFVPAMLGGIVLARALRTPESAPA